MSFMDKLNATRNPAAAAEKKVNPLLKQPAPPVAPPATTAKVVTPVAPAAPLATATPKVNPLAKAAVPAATAPAVAPTEVPKKTLAFPFKKKEEPVAPVAPVVQAEVPAPVVAETPAPVAVEAPVAAEVKAEETVVVPPVEEKKAAAAPARRANNRGKKTDTKEDGPATDLETAEELELPTTTMSFAEAAAVLTSPFADEVWDAFKLEIEEELNAIIIDQDMNPGVLKVILSELNLVYDKIAQPLHETRTLLENLTNKEDGTIVVIKSISLGGSNDMERKRAGFLSAMSYKPKSGGGNINLFEAAAEVRSRYNFLKGIYDRLKYKNDMLITMNGALKLERDFVTRGDN